MTMKRVTILALIGFILACALVLSEKTGLMPPLYGYVAIAVIDIPGFFVFLMTDSILEKIGFHPIFFDSFETIGALLFLWPVIFAILIIIPVVIYLAYRILRSIHPVP